jgi:hypothetical protein
VGVGAHRLNICKTIYKVLRQFIRNWASTSTSKMGVEIVAVAKSREKRLAVHVVDPLTGRSGTVTYKGNI